MNSLRLTAPRPRFRSRVAPDSTGSRWWIRLGLTLGVIPALLLPAGAAEGDAAKGVARIASIQNRVETRSGTSDTWSPSAVNQALAARDRVRTGEASRAAILYSDQTLHRLGEKSEVEILPPSGENAGVLKVLSGKHYFSSRTPKDYGKIETPTVTAAIKGTEFVVEVGEGSATTISMLEGVVLASNEQGSLEVHTGEAAYVEPGKAPVRRTLVRPRDAVAWALYYPPVLSSADAARARALGPDGESLITAAEMLSTGQVDQARPLIESARKAHPEDPVALSLSSVVELVGNNRAEAARLATEAVKAGPDSAAAALADSFVAQASFDLERAGAMAEKAAELDPASAEALARAAELRLARRDVEGARKAAEAALGRSPDHARALAVLGFVELTEYRSAEAEKQFEKSVAADPGLALGHLGLGIARIRRGKVDAGREELQTAAVLDPSDALARSYLGKAYYEEKRSREAGKEFDAAKNLDPTDPTPFLYDAIRKQNDNRPLEALDDLNASVERNDNRAVYRSRLLLDQDQAVRSSDLARIYNDLGFEQLGLVTGRRSADEDHANYSSHLLLSGNYRFLPGYAPAFLSEVLQARIYQPTGVNAVRPDVVSETVSFNEYTALFDRPRARAFIDMKYAQTDTDFDELNPSDPSFLDPDTLDDSESLDGTLTGTLNGDRYAAAISYRKLDDDGFRRNSDQKNANYRGFFQFSPTWRDSFQVNLLHGRRETGDLPLRELPFLVGPERLETVEDNFGLGYHRVVSARSDIAVSAIYNNTEQTGTIPGSGFSTTGTLKGPQLEYQQILRGQGLSWIFGAGGFDGQTDLESPFGDLSSDDTFLNGYAYLKLRDIGPLEITAGASVEKVDAPAGILPPRDSNFIPTEVNFSETRVSPKVGLSAHFGKGTTLRAAGYYRLSPAIGRLQTLEPTQVAGFNQFFEDPGGTRSKSYGAGVDQAFGKRLFAGFTYLRRDLTIPEAYCDAPDPFGGCAFQPVTHIEDRNSDDDLWTAYLSAGFGRRVSAGVEYSLEERDFDFTQINPVGLFEDSSSTERLRPQVRWFLPNGFFAGAAGTRIDQEVDQFDDLTSNVRTEVTATFWVADVQVGYRLPNRWGSVLLEGRNVTDREFEFFSRAIQDEVIPARTIALRGIFTY